jgi:hypothetical protein
MTSQLIHRLKSKNQQLQSEIQRLRAENQAAMEREKNYRNELKDKRRQDEERLERLMLNGACGLFSIVC